MENTMKTKESDISKALGDQQQLITEIDERLSVLHDTLTPVLRNEISPAEKTENEVPKSNVPLAAEIMSSNNRLIIVISAINRLLSLIDV